jgi:hypothetical protein
VADSAAGLQLNGKALDARTTPTHMARHLTDHPLVADAWAGMRAYLVANKEAFLKAQRKGGTMRAKKQRPPKAKLTQYQHMVFEHTTNVSADLDRLENILLMVRKLPPARTLEKWRLTQDEWLKYQYTMHLVTVDGAVDRCFRVANAVMNLGLAARKCTERVLLEQTSVKRTRVGTALRRLLKETKATRELRDLDVHRKELPPFYKIVGFEEYDWLPAFAMAAKDGATIADSKVVHRMFRYSGQVLSMKLQKERTRLMQAVWRLFDVLVPVAQRMSAICSLADLAASNMALNPSVGRGRPPTA